MNRQIKFRAKTTANGHWVYGSLIDYGDNTFAIRNRKSQPWVDPATVGQFTGLRDRNGKEIYEGDILAFKWFDGDIVEVDHYPVYYLGGAFCLRGEYDLTPLYEQDMKRYEVIGNIHDNPELMGNKQSKS